MAETAAGIMVDTLLHWGVEVVFGLPGDGINGIMEALRRRQDKIRFVQVRHEEAAAFMACGYAKYTGRLGVCLATSGPGGIHLLNGLYDAKLDGQPVLAITGHHFHDLIDTHAQQDVDLDKLFMDVAVYNARIMGAAHVAPVTNLACRTALELSRRRAHQFSRGYAGLHIGRTLTARCPGSYERHLARGQAYQRKKTCNTPKKFSTAGPRSPSSPGAARSARQMNWKRLPKSWERRSSRRCWAKPPFPTIVPIQPAASVYSAHALRRKRWKNATRFYWSARLSPTLSFCPNRARRRPCRSISIRSESAYVIRSRSDSSAMRARL